MAQIIYSARALADIECAFEFLVDRDPASAVKAADAIRHAVETLACPANGGPKSKELTPEKKLIDREARMTITH